MNQLILTCEDSLEGILTAVYDAYALHCVPADTHIEIEGAGETYRLFSEYRHIATSPEKAEKVLRTIFRRFGQNVYAQLCRALVSCDPARADAVYHTIVCGIAKNYSGNLLENLADDDVRKVFELQRNTGFEIEHLMGFLRFRELESGVLLAVFAPKNDILTSLMLHFSDRLPREDFALYDDKRKYFGIHPAGQPWYQVREEMADVPRADAPDEERWQQLYKHFCHTIAIEERVNPKLQRNMLPLRFRGYMTEFSS